jgi:hypothetical protein
MELVEDVQRKDATTGVEISRVQKGEHVAAGALGFYGEGLEAE